jgi:hypothetical protein
MNKMSTWLIAIVLVLGLGGAYLWWQQEQAQPVPPPPPPVTVRPPAPVAPPPVEAPPPPPPPVIQHPVEEVKPPSPKAAPLPALKDADKTVKDALDGLLGHKKVLTFVHADDFVRHCVATVDSLAQGHSASRLWPVLPAGGRLQVDERADGPYLADANALRYRAFVRFVTSVDSAKAAKLYLYLYPLFQQAYEELGYKGKYFNDRLVEVIDQLLQTPEPQGAVKLRLLQVQGEYTVERPWLNYEFDDPDLEARPAGQKILLRMGLDNARQLKAKLQEIRRHIAKGKKKS